MKFVGGLVLAFGALSAVQAHRRMPSLVERN